MFGRKKKDAPARRERITESPQRICITGADGTMYDGALTAINIPEKLIIELSDDYAAGFEQAFLRRDDALGAATPLSAIASARHETQYSRLFRS